MVFVKKLESVMLRMRKLSVHDRPSQDFCSEVFVSFVIDL
jgi:hypothetical protein